MRDPVLWEGIGLERYPTDVRVINGNIQLRQEDDVGCDVVSLSPNEAIDIAFAILRDLAPTLHETLEKLNAKS